MTDAPSAVEIAEIATVLGDEIEALYAEATNNPCICNIDENACCYCNAWSRATRESYVMIAAILQKDH